MGTFIPDCLNGLGDAPGKGGSLQMAAGIWLQRTLPRLDMEQLTNPNPNLLPNSSLNPNSNLLTLTLTLILTSSQTLALSLTL